METTSGRKEEVSREGKRRGKYLPRELRIKIYNDVLVLRRGGLSYRRIVEEIYRRYGVRISKSRIGDWLRGVHNPYNGMYIPSLELLKPSEDLAYVIGVKVGDGYVTKRRRVHKGYCGNEGFAQIIGLHVKDKEFAEEFAKRLAKILRREPIKPRYERSSGSGYYVVEVQSKTLYELLKKPVDLDRLRKYIEHCDRCIAAFLRGFADSEGSVEKNGHILIYNTDYELLKYVKKLLRRLGIYCTGPRLHSQGDMTRKDYYCIYIRTSSNKDFYKYIGFTIRRKQERLENYLRRTGRLQAGTP
jgi:intein-encoded DNA endonuclease-like protein